MSAAKTFRPSSAITDDWSESLQNGAAAAISGPQKLAEAGFEAGDEIIRFVSRRLKAQADLLDGLGHCGDFNQVADAHRLFWENISKDYMSELNQLGEMAQKNLAAILNAAQPR